MCLWSLLLGRLKMGDRLSPEIQSQTLSKKKSERELEFFKLQNTLFLICSVDLITYCLLSELVLGISVCRIT